MTYYAHSENAQTGERQPLREHLNAVADLSGRFAAEIGGEKAGRALGLLHDAGKYRAVFQNRLQGSGEPVDHKTYGARLAVERYGPYGKLLAYAVAGHHRGLPDGIDAGNDGAMSLSERLALPHEPLPAFFQENDLPPNPVAEKRLPGGKCNGNGAAFFVRMLFSCLVDGDYLDTEAHFAPEQRALRGGYPTLETVSARFDAYWKAFDADAAQKRAADPRLGRVYEKRMEVRAQCLAAAELAPGLFTLNVPTGGGKTLSSLAFALKHAARYGMKRIVFAVPFISVTEQNAGVIRRAVGEDAVVEHHSSLDERGEDGRTNRLATENWDAPVIVTTNVQLFESLYSHKTARCRKLHNLARSVIILDEAQAIPEAALKPCLLALALLCRDYGTTVVLCTATQPEYEGIWPEQVAVRPIIPNPEELREALRRTRFVREGMLSDDALAERLREERQVLCVVNTRKHAADLFRRIQDTEGAFHLSARMCPAHRLDTLDAIRRRLADDLPCRVASTNLVEAGVDIDFPTVYRAMAGVDSLVQAAGRCNREGKNADGPVHVFMPERGNPPGWLGRTASFGGEVLRRFEDPASGEAIAAYYELRFGLGAELDQYRVLEAFERTARGFDFPFRTVGERFRLIDAPGVPLVIPYNQEARDILTGMRGAGNVSFSQRKLQRYTVSLYENELRELMDRGVVEQMDGIYALACDAESFGQWYDEKLGLTLNGTLGILQY